MTAMVVSKDFPAIERAFAESSVGLPKKFQEWLAQSDHVKAGAFVSGRQLRKFVALQAPLGRLRAGRPTSNEVQWAVPERYQGTHVRLSTLAPMLRLHGSILSTHGPQLLKDYVTTTYCERKGKDVHLVATSKLKEIQIECTGALSHQGVAERLDVAEEVVRRLVGRQMLAKPEKPYLRRFVTIKSLKKLESQLSKNAILDKDLPVEVRFCLSELVNQVSAPRRRRGAAEFLRDIMKSRLRVFAASADAQSFRDYYVDRGDFVRWCNGERLAD
ncbi:hypothetical protein [Variovorax sp. E3]|uniref:hypothetical protein n=1 Tax=Variovorax sp. E3 TaxID=1914993 RepID=UPI0018DBDDBC|nr:hypothetical protein [Variovorax sp. E3]